MKTRPGGLDLERRTKAGAQTHGWRELTKLRRAAARAAEKAAAAGQAPVDQQARAREAGLLPDEELSGKFFARIRAFDLACPRCGEVSVVSKASTSCWNARLSLWRCSGCGLKLKLGVLAHRVRRSARRGIPGDIVPTLRQAIQLRELVQGKAMPDSLRVAGADPINAVVEEPCGCACGCYPEQHQGKAATRGRCTCQLRGCPCVPEEGPEDLSGGPEGGE